MCVYATLLEKEDTPDLSLAKTASTSKRNGLHASDLSKGRDHAPEP